MRKLFLYIFLFSALYASSCIAADSDGDGISDEVEASLAESFAPVLRLAKDEAFFPVTIQYTLNNSILKRLEDEVFQTISEEPTPLKLSNYAGAESKYFLDNKQGTIDDDGVRSHFAEIKDDLVPTVYSRVTAGNSTVIVQYWLFYPFNEGPLNRHEGDWEMVQFVLQDEEPISAGYSQHTTGQSATWDQVLLRNDHPIVYVAKGSHANYFRSYQGVLGFQSDEVSGNGPILTPEDYEMVPLGELDKYPNGQGWIHFSGRWGEWGEASDELRGRRGPPGPAHGDNARKWTQAELWQSDIREVNGRWLWLSWLVSNFPILFGVFLLIGALWKFIGLGRVVVSGHPFKGLGIGAGMAVTGAVLAIFAIWQPWYYVRLDVPEGPYSTDGEVDIMIFSGIDGLQINDPESNRGLVNVFAAKIPFGIFLVSSLVFLLLDTTKAQNPRELETPYLRSAISNILVPLVPLVILVAFLSPVVSDLIEARVEGGTPGSVVEMLEEVSYSPAFGSYDGEIPEVGRAKLSWGLGTGTFIILAGGVLKLGGSLICRRAGTDGDTSGL